MSSAAVAKDADAARRMAVRLLEDSVTQSAEQAPVTVAQAQVWATLAVSLELASGVETYVDQA